jgi:hypothetical protein
MNEVPGRYHDASFSSLELAALQWLEGFYQLEHLLCARKWVVRLRPGASTELKFAALVHDAERNFPGGPMSTPRDGFDDPNYLFAHSIRSADIVQDWLLRQQPTPLPEFIRRVRALILRHEIGGNWEEDILQAADSLSFLESLDWLAVEWVRKGQYSTDGAREKLTWMVERIRPSVAVDQARPLYVLAVHAVDTAHECTLNFTRRRAAASNLGLLTGLANHAIRRTNTPAAPLR